MRIRFVKAYKVPVAGGQSFAAGEEIELPQASAKRYVESGVAEAVGGEAVSDQPKDTGGQATSGTQMGGTRANGTRKRRKPNGQ